MTAAGDPGRGILSRDLDLSPPLHQRESLAPVTEQAFQCLYAATSGPILGYLVAVTGRHHIAEDLLQETYIRFLARPRPFMDTEQARRYLFRIATNLLRDRWRRGEDQAFSEPAEPSAEHPFDTTLDVRAALLRLKPRERELLWLAYVEGMDHAEIAAVTGLQRLSVRLLLYRARNKAALLLNPSQSNRSTDATL